jgi:hypothetical protein
MTSFLVTAFGFGMVHDLAFVGDVGFSTGVEIGHLLLAIILASLIVIFGLWACYSRSFG